MKKLLLTFDDVPNGISNKIIFHNTEDMKVWFCKDLDTFTSVKFSDDMVNFEVAHSWTSFATFEYIE